MADKIETHPIAKKLGWKVGEDYPVEGNNALYLTTIQGEYLQKGETPNQGYKRLASTAAKFHNDESLEPAFYEILSKLWLIPSTPVCANFGTDRGLPISCFSGKVGDDMFELNRKSTEMSMLSKAGGGTAYDFSDIRPIGSPIRNGENGKSDGIIPFIKGYDSWILASKQGSLRRGAVAIYLNAEHEEFPDFLEIREPKGEVQRQCHNIHQGAIFTDDFMNKVVDKNGKERELWLSTLKKRVKTGEPYTMFIDNANKVVPEWWKTHNLKIHHSNLCSEIFLPTDENHSLVCCLSSLNLAKYDEWKDTNTVFLATLFLDAVISEFLEKAKEIKLDKYDSFKIYNRSCEDLSDIVEDKTIDCVCTSPPYPDSIRTYSEDDKNVKKGIKKEQLKQLGQEATIEEYIEKMVMYVRECMRTLKSTGSIWINIS